MKKILSLYDSVKLPIRITYFGFILLAIGFLIQNDSVNLFYTFRSSAVLFAGEVCLRMGQLIITNLPLFFAFSLVCKKANSGVPISLLIVGYFSFQVTMMSFGVQTLGSTAYSTSGINSFLTGLGKTSSSFETGLVGAFIVAYLTRFSFVLSRNRSQYSLLGFLSKDIAALLYNLLFCMAAGLVVAFAYPYFYSFLQGIISYISKDLTDPVRIAAYALLDRILSIGGMNLIDRIPFWFSSLGGALQVSSTGQTYLGDVSIWTYLTTSTASYEGCGRFITGFYVLNMFVAPGIYFGMLSSVTNKKEKGRHLVIVLFLSIFSIMAGSPLPLELLMLFTSPLLLVMYLVLAAVIFGGLVKYGIYLGFSCTSNEVLTSLPGNFPDLIVNIRNLNYTSTIIHIIIAGLISLIIAYFMARWYYRYLAYDVLDNGDLKKTADQIIEAVGGKSNIRFATSGFLKLDLQLNDLEAVSIEALKNIGARRVSETKSGISVECGDSAYIISKKIASLVK